MNNSKVYVIEDDEMASFMIKKILKSNSNISTSEFYTNGLLALEKLKALNLEKEQFPCFIILDFNMPVMNGKEFIEAIRNLKDINQIPIFMNSGTIEFEEYRNCLNYENVKGIFFKPFSKQTLDTILELVSGD